MTTEFRESSLCRKIPRGKVSTYREIGKEIGKGRVFRAVGAALRKNPFSPKVPCHRVVRSDSSIGGFKGKKSGFVVRQKIFLLKKEGVFVKKGKVAGFKKKLFKF